MLLGVEGGKRSGLGSSEERGSGRKRGSFDESIATIHMQEVATFNYHGVDIYRE